MSGRVKWLLGGLGFLGANGVALPTLNSSLGLFDSIDNLGWGGASIMAGKWSNSISQRE